MRILFWIAYVHTRPFGATYGDLLTQSTGKRGLDLGTVGSSSVLFGILLILTIYSFVKLNTHESFGLNDQKNYEV